MGICDWKEDDWATLIHTIERGNCILILGPNFVVEEYKGEKKSSTEILAYELAQTDQVKTEVKEWKIDPYNLAHVAQCYDLKDRRYDLEEKVFHFYDKRDTLSVDFHVDIASLPFSFIITTTPDKAFSNSLQKVNKKPVINVYNFNGNNKDTVSMGTTEKPLLYYLFGNIAETDSLVLTEDDILDFLINIATKNPKLPNNILSKIRDSRQTMLFLGFNFKNWYLRVLLHVLNIGKKKGPLFCIGSVFSKGGG